MHALAARRDPAGSLAAGGADDALPSAEAIRAELERELGGGLRTWEAILDEYGYMPTGIGCQSVLPGVPFDRFADSGGHAHLIYAAAQWIHYLEGRRD